MHMVYYRKKSLDDYFATEKMGYVKICNDINNNYAT